MKFASKTDIGKMRRTNQDSYAVGNLPSGVLWAVVCDGMGGVGGGQLASATAVKEITENLSLSWHSGMNSNAIRSALQSALFSANIKIFDLSKSSESLTGMGTTAVAVVIDDSVAHIVHVGDSRVYKISKDKSIERITRDHSLVEMLLSTGQITEQEAQNHPRKNLITRALGTEENVEIDYNEIFLSEDEGLLLCTDGLSSYVEQDEIEKILKENQYSDCPDKLIESANDKGGKDNVTVVIIG